MMKNTRERIVSVSLSLFLKKTFKEVTIKEIVDKTGVSQGAFFHYFETKEQLFLEIVDNIFQSTLLACLNKLNKETLYQYYHDYVDWFIGSPYLQNESEEFDNQSSNYFSLIFEAIKIFPGFQKKLLEYLQLELNAWMKIIQTAKNNGEIKSLIPDEQIARMFIYSSDGAGIRSIFTKSSSIDTRNTLLNLWNSYYDLLKA